MQTRRARNSRVSRLCRSLERESARVVGRRHANNCYLLDSEPVRLLLSDSRVRARRS